MRLGAAGKSVSADAAANIKTSGKTLVDLKVLSQEDILALQCDMADMKSALMDVRRNGINEVAMTSANGGNNSKTVDLGKVESPEVKMAIIKVLGLQFVALPEEIDHEFYNTLMAMDGDPSKKQAYLDSIKPRISKEALQATEARLNEAIEHAKKLNKEGNVYSDGDWKTYMNLIMV